MVDGARRKTENGRLKLHEGGINTTRSTTSTALIQIEPRVVGLQLL